MNKSLSQSLSLCCIKCCVNLCRGFWFCFRTSFTLICMAELFFQRFFNFLCDLVLSARGRLLWFGFLANLFVFGIWKFSSNLEHSKCSLSTFLALRNFWNSFPFTVGVFAAQVAGEILKSWPKVYSFQIHTRTSSSHAFGKK